METRQAAHVLEICKACDAAEEAVETLYKAIQEYNIIYNAQSKGPCDALVTCEKFEEMINMEVHTVVTTG